MAKIVEYKKHQKIQITKNFASTEFDCKCKDPECTRTLIDTDHVEKLQKLRNKLKKPIKINSAFRCEKWNKISGGATRSRHLQGDATDISVKGMSSEEVAEKCKSFTGMGLYNSFIHLDSRPMPKGKKARWDLRSKK